jgi:hypothetical protein
MQEVMTKKKIFNINSFRIFSVILAALGAAGSLYFIFRAGHHQKSILLITLFIAWVLFPFAILFVASKMSTGWTAFARLILYWLTIILAVGSVVIYSGAVTPQKTKPAFLFLIVPLISLIFIIVAIMIARKTTRE